MRIAHISDLHIRNFKYRSEYRIAFNNLYKRLEELRPDLIINTGDTVHSKLAVSPELFDDVAWHFLRASQIADYWIILGNHDLNLKNKGRLDAISPVVKALQGRTEHDLILLNEGEFIHPDSLYMDFRFWNYDIRGHGQFNVDKDKINVGLYHGSISGCVTDIGFVMEEAESEVSKFDAMDYVLMGDIHKRQSFRDGRVRYPGSLIQQNYGEELEKGFLLWNIKDKENFSVDFHPIEAPGRFYTVQVQADLDISNISVPDGSRIRAAVQGELTPSRRLELERALVEKFKPIEVITPDSSGDKATSQTPDIDTLVGSREQMMRDHLKEKGVDGDDADAVIDLFNAYEKDLELDNSARGTTWQLQKISWDNMMNYGEGNVVDVTKLKGLVGVFAPNASGKSSIFDIMLQSLFDKVAKDVPRNIDLVNDNKDSGKMVVEFEANGRPYSIERTIERIHYGQRKLAETKQWGKTSLEFSSVDDSLNGDSRPETERAIRAIVGNFDDFALTTMVSQNPIFGLPGGGDIINCRETDRRKILFRFLDLDVYEKVNQACKEELKGIIGSIKGQEKETVEAEIEDIDAQLLNYHVSLTDERSDLAEREAQLTNLNLELDRLKAADDVKLWVKAQRLDDSLVKRTSALKRAAKNLEDAKQIFETASKNVENHTKNKPNKPSIPMDELALKMSQVRAELERAKVNVAKGRDNVARGKKALVTLQDIPCDGKFPTCKFIADATREVSDRDIVEATLKGWEEAAKEQTDEMTRLENYSVLHREAVRWEKELSAFEIALERATSGVATAQHELDEAARKHAEVKIELDDVRSKIDHNAGEKIKDVELLIEKCQASVNEGKSQIEALLKLIGGLDAKKDRLSKDLAKLIEMKQRVAAYERLVELTGKTGLPYKILTLVLPIINDEISKILTAIVKFNVFFEDDPEEQTVSLYIRYGDYKSRPLSLGSGAEKFIASLAIRVALLSVSSLPKTDILIIDEGFGKLDPEHLEALQKMFEYLREAFGTVFIVSHVDSMRDVVDHSLDITSLDGYAHVEAV